MSLIPTKQSQESKEMQAKTPAKQAPQYVVLAHPYIFKTCNKEFRPDTDGVYHPKSEEEIAAFEHFVSKRFVRKI